MGGDVPIASFFFRLKEPDSCFSGPLMKFEEADLPPVLEELKVRDDVVKVMTDSKYSCYTNRTHIELLGVFYPLK